MPRSAGLLPSIAHEDFSSIMAYRVSSPSLLSVVLLLAVAACSDEDKGALGQGCFDNGTCQPGLYCAAGTCAQRGVAGNKCFEDGTCESGLYCSQDVCKARKAAGETCEASEECASPNLCYGDKCAVVSCASCGPLEQCYDNRFCVAKPVSITGGYSIDATEVTRNQYAAWLAASPSVSAQDPWCTWNVSFTPTSDWPPGSLGNNPVYVDWCDAFAYCKAVGKRMCGKIGGGANDFADYADPSKSEWHNACSSGGVNDYPYGDTYDGSACNGYDAPGSSTVTVGKMTSCQSSVTGYGGVFDLSGNVREWENSCLAASGKDDDCRTRGSNTTGTQSKMRCDAEDSASRGSNAGIRCCGP